MTWQSESDQAMTENASQGDTFLVKVGSDTKVIAKDDIIYFFSENHATYLFLNSSRAKYLYEKPLKKIEQLLEFSHFFRIHRKAIINLNFVHRLINNFRYVKMTDGERFPIAKSRRKTFAEVYQQFLRQKANLKNDHLFQPIVRPDRLFRGAKLWRHQLSQGCQFIKAKPPSEKFAMNKFKQILDQPQALWFDESHTDIYHAVKKVVEAAARAQQVPVLVAFRLFFREETKKRTVSLQDFMKYQQWIRDFAAAVNAHPAIIIIEPNALAMCDQLESVQQQNMILALIRDAVETLRRCPNAYLYLDAGHPYWHTPHNMALSLARAGIDLADGFALNVAQYIHTELNIEYGEAISKLLGDRHFVIDTSRNGRGIVSPQDWCNPPGCGLGQPPTFETQHSLVDAFLWIKPPGESDGIANGGPEAGLWWSEKALELVEYAAV